MLPTQPPTADTHTFKQVPRNSANTHHVDSTHHLDCRAAVAGAPTRTAPIPNAAESRLCSHTLVLSWFAHTRACYWNSRARCQIGAPLLLKAPVVAAAVFR
ncbi:hypothetical protein GQ54DRAFT_296643 [Martensiomyces pterosporus]|nr:hypothetical protein GQ54DRAFT_296643 [Martensiomyces pterosporus]